MAKLPGEDKIAKWKAEAQERERQRTEARAKLSEQERAQIVDVEELRAAIAVERQFLEQVVGKAIGELLQQELEEAKDE